MEKKEKKSVGHLSKAQKSALLDLIKEKPQLRSGKFSKEFTLKDAQAEWESIALVLNAIPGSKKDWRLWRKTWQDLQSKAKSKKATFNKSMNKTGGGPPPDPLDDFEEGVVGLINKNSVVGHEGVEESIAHFDNMEEPGLDIIFISPPEEFKDDSQQENIASTSSCKTPSSKEEDASTSSGVTLFMRKDNAPTSSGITPSLREDNLEKRSEKGRTQPSKKINIKTLLKEKLELKKKIVDNTIIFQKEFIKVQEERNQILKDLTNKLDR